MERECVYNGSAWRPLGMPDISAIMAAKMGHFECLKYAIDNRCSWSKETLEAAKEKGDEQIINYLKQKARMSPTQM